MGRLLGPRILRIGFWGGRRRAVGREKLVVGGIALVVGGCRFMGGGLRRGDSNLRGPQWLFGEMVRGEERDRKGSGNDDLRGIEIDILVSRVICID